MTKIASSWVLRTCRDCGCDIWRRMSSKLTRCLGCLGKWRRRVGR